MLVEEQEENLLEVLVLVVEVVAHMKVEALVAHMKVEALVAHMKVEELVLM